jgi:hypothetical protein
VVWRTADNPYDLVALKLLECDVARVKDRIEFADYIPGLPPGDGLLAMVFLIKDPPYVCSDSTDLTLFFPIPDRSRSHGMLDRFVVARFISWGELETVSVPCPGAVSYRISDGGHRVEIQIEKALTVYFPGRGLVHVSGSVTIEDPHSSQRLFRAVKGRVTGSELIAMMERSALIDMARRQLTDGFFRGAALDAVAEFGDRKMALAVGQDLPSLTHYAFEAVADCLTTAHARLRDPAIAEIVLREFESRTGTDLENLHGIVYGTPFHLAAIERLLRCSDPDRVTLGAAWILRLDPITAEQKARLAAALPDFDDHEKTPGLWNVLLHARERVR